MGSELVEAVPLTGGVAGSATPFSFTKIYHEALPYYITIGMPTDEFWNGEPELVKVYAEAYELKRRRDAEDMWMQGVYFYEALIRVAPLLNGFVKNPKAEPYTPEPYPITPKSLEEYTRRKDEERKQRELEQWQAWAEMVKAKMQAKKERQGELNG